ncbi:MAG: DUF2608 domain-containing protein [Chlamydiales bacterium]|nr:DUF2608 domain-containing protein [Chlamydiales bacterium]
MKNKFLIIPLICLVVVGIIWFVQSPTSSKETPQQSSAHVVQDVTFSGGIIPIQSFNDIRSELDSTDADTLVVFDVDDVLITYNDMVLRPSGAHFRPASWKGIDPKEIPYLISIMLNEGQIILIDHSTPLLINKLKSKGVKTIALTAARTGKFGVIESAEEWRLKVLKQFDIDFSKSFSTKQIYFDNIEKKETEYSLFKDGVLFLGDEKTTKGALLVQFLKKVQWTPKKVIFIDDKMSHLTSVEAALNKAKIPFQGYQYKGADKLPGKLDEQIAEVQFSHLRKDHKWLSDSEAKKEEQCLSALHQ